MMPKRRWLTKDRLLEIRKISENCLRSFGYTGGSIDMTSFAESLGATLKFAPYDDDGDLAGMLVKERGKPPVIAVNSAHHPNRRRFTIAHECGHLILHDKDFFIDEKLSIRMRNSDSSLAISIEEIEANQFAAEVLMPFKQIVRDIDELHLDIEDDADSKALAKKYKVSPQAMTYRIGSIASDLLIY